MTPRRRRAAADSRAHVLEVAHELFYWQGIRGTGVDTIAAAAGVAPTTLYRLFESKDDLVAAYVERAAGAYRAWFDDALGPEEDPACTRILRLFDALGEQVRPEHCRGCPFLMALSELPDPDHPGHRHAVALKEWVRGRFRELAGDRGDHVMLVFEGVYASTQALTAAGPARDAKGLAGELLG